MNQQRNIGGAVDLSHLAARSSEANASSASTTTTQVVDVPALIVDATEQSFEQLAQLSGVVPVVFYLWGPQYAPCAELTPVLEAVTREFSGRMMLAKVEADAHPGLAQAFQATAIPTVVGLIGGRPVPLFQGPIGEGQLRELLSQLTKLAEQQGVVGRVNAPDMPAADEAAAPKINPAHQAALAALEQGDYQTAIAEYEKVLTKAPADNEAHAALAQVKLLARLQGKSVDEIRGAAAAAPTDVAAQMLVADLDISGGHVEDGFLRLLDLFAASSDETERTQLRERMLELFEVVGVSDPRVNAARGKLASLLY